MMKIVPPTFRLLATLSLINLSLLPANAKLFIENSSLNNPLTNLVSELEVTSKRNEKVSIEASYYTKTGLSKKIINRDKENSDPQNSSAIIDYFLLQQPRPNTPSCGYCLTLNELTLPVSTPLITAIQQKSIETKSVIYLRAIPAHVLNRYPQLFSKEEIFMAQNLRVLPASFATTKGLTDYRKYWIELFKSYKVPNKQDVLDVLSRTDNRFQNTYVKL